MTSRTRAARARYVPTKYDPRRFLAALRGGARTREYPARRTVFAQGDPSDSVYYIETGRVQLSSVSPRGREAIVSTLSAGTFFGEACLTGQTVRLAAAHTLVNSTLTRVPRRTMLRAIEKDPGFSGYFVTYLLGRNLRIEEDLISHMFDSSEIRLARLLVRMAHVGRGGTIASIPQIDQATLARMVGTTRERISHFMNKFRRLGLIEYNGNLQVHTSLINVILAG